MCEHFSFWQVNLLRSAAFAHKRVTGDRSTFAANVTRYDIVWACFSGFLPEFSSEKEY